MHSLLRSVLTAVLVAMFSLVSVGIRAQPRGDDAPAAKKIRDTLPTDELKKRWKEGVDFYNDGDFDAALVEFQAVHEATKNPRILYNLSVCYRKLANYSRAIVLLERQLTFRDELPRSEITRSEQLLGLLRDTVTPLELVVDQEGATVTLNGLDLGQTPLLAPVTANVGKNVLEVRKPGFRDVRREFRLPKGEAPRKLEVSLEPETKTTRVTVAVNGPADAIIFIDGTEMGPSPYSGDLAIGRHTIEARAPGFVTARQTSVLQFGQPLRVTLTLTEAKRQGKLRVITDHPDATIILDEEMVGTGAWEGVVATGGRILRVVKEGYLDYQTEVALDAEQERTLRVTLKEDPTPAYVFWSVTGVLVAAGIGVGAYFVLRPETTAPVDGTFNPGQVPTLFRF
ncbi:MAG: PEGA domain-containing protein [Myxococcota bacterium]